MRKGMGRTMVSATQTSSVTLLVAYIWQPGSKENYCKFAHFNTCNIILLIVPRRYFCCGSIFYYGLMSGRLREIAAHSV